MKKGGKQQESGLGQAILLIMAIALVIFLSPGLLAVGIAKFNYEVNLDVGQMWTFATITSVALFGIIFVFRRSFMRALKSYLFICILIDAIALISHFGFKAEWPVKYMQSFLPNESSIMQNTGHN